VLSEEDYNELVKRTKEDYDGALKAGIAPKSAHCSLMAERLLWLNPNSTSLVRAHPNERRDMVRAYRQVELELFGSVVELRGEKELLQESPVESVTAPFLHLRSPVPPADDRVPESRQESPNQSGTAAKQSFPHSRSSISAAYVRVPESSQEATESKMWLVALKIAIVALLTVCALIGVTWIVWTDGHKILAVLSAFWAIGLLLKLPEMATIVVTWEAARPAVKTKRRAAGLVMIAAVCAVVWLLSWADYILLRDIALVLGAGFLLAGFECVVA
jgi:hypothetical protein